MTCEKHGEGAMSNLGHCRACDLDAANVVDFQQRRGVALDIIDEALSGYREFMLDDDYNAQRALDQIMTRMADRRAQLKN